MLIRYTIHNNNNTGAEKMYVFSLRGSRAAACVYMRRWRRFANELFTISGTRRAHRPKRARTVSVVSALPVVYYTLPLRSAVAKPTSSRVIII